MKRASDSLVGQPVPKQMMTFVECLPIPNVESTVWFFGNWLSPNGT
jgi:hypothetical protein